MDASFFTILSWYSAVLIFVDLCVCLLGDDADDGVNTSDALEIMLLQLATMCCLVVINNDEKKRKK